MKHRLGSTITTSVVLPATVLTLAGGPRLGASGIATGKTSLEKGEIETLAYIREEEKLARDVYLTLAVVRPLDIFSSIAKSEQSHMDTVLKMLDKYGLRDPAEGLGIGQFSDASGLQPIYDGLVATGAESKTKAMKVGVFIEETDIDDLTMAIAETDNPDLIQMYTGLKAASVKHLLAFSQHPASQQVVPVAE